MTHICVGKLTTIVSDNGLSPGRRQAIIWTNAGILLIGPSWTNFGEILIEIHTFSFKKMHLKISSGKWRPFCLGLNVLTVRRVVAGQTRCLGHFELCHEVTETHYDNFRIEENIYNFVSALCLLMASWESDVKRRVYAEPSLRAGNIKLWYI